MSLEASLSLSVDRMRGLAHAFSGYLNELEMRLPGDEAARHAFINARTTMGCVHAEITQMKAVLAAARMTGQAVHVATVAVEELELHPRNLPGPVCSPDVPQPRTWREREKLLQSLHRAGDHTLDPTETAEVDRNVAIYEEGKEAGHGA